MRHLVLAGVLALGPGAALADPIEGVWQTQPDDGKYAHVTMAPCGPAFCGVISRTFDPGGEYRGENIGRTLVIDMVPNGDGTYSGQVWRPSNNRIYTGGATVSGDRMQLRGCVAGGLLCKSQTWTRVE
ncbi:MAG: DUF2147 domain-containing protein [Rhodobacteraceae bacterium]|nr:DUF2147 domain-containing protein [Paracoccaceae bacterium]